MDNLNKQKLIIYELNELPPKLLNYYCQLKPNSKLAKFTKKGRAFTTITKDYGELHPWTTWPTVHRGIGREVHQISFLNQPLDYLSNYPPVWEILQTNNISTGVFGSLHSHQKEYKSKYISFHLPDTFAPDSYASHDGLQLFQEFNLDLTQKNKATQRSIPIIQIKQLINLILKREISIYPPLKALIHLFNELRDRKFKPRRPMMQAHFTFDIYKNYLSRYKPEFSTFFSNHLASMMHRYWKYLFINDEIFDNVSFQSKSIIKAMDIADRQISELIDIGKKNNYQIWIISSMGQDRIERGNYIPEICISDFDSILKVCALDCDKYKMLPAMQPDICIEAYDKNYLDFLLEKLNYLVDSDKNKIFSVRYQPINNRVNLFINNSKSVPLDKEIYFLDKKYHTYDLSMELINRDIGTGYHVPQGVFISDYPIEFNDNTLDKNGFLDTRKILPLILNFFDIKKADYML